VSPRTRLRRSTWPPIQVGKTTGHWLEKCNEAAAIVPVGAGVYVFTWANQTFNTDSHMPEADFKTVLVGVTLPDAADAQTPLFSPSPSSAP
jgi:hypothetical protein